MTTKLKVLAFDERRMCSDCQVLESDEPFLHVGRTVYVDLTVNADFEDMPETDLIGKTVTVQGLQPHEFLGIGVSIVSD